MARIIVCAAALCAVAATTWAGVPNALDTNVIRLGPALGVGLEKYYDNHYSSGDVKGGGGGALWLQFDATNFSYIGRLSVLALLGDGETYYVDWENEYPIYLAKGKFRPYLAPGAGIRRAERPGRGETEGIWLFYFGIRLNSMDTPFFVTLGGGYKYASYGFAEFHNRYYLALNDDLALNLALELGSEFGSDRINSFARAEFGPSFSF
jgi:hypothetical protein